MSDDDGVAGSDGERWGPALHNLYLVTLVIAVVATALSFPVGVDWLVAGVAAATFAVGDLAMRRVPAGRYVVVSGYFLAAGAVLGVLTAVFPTFAAVAFGLLPLVFVRLPRWAAVAVGVVATGSPLLIQPYVHEVMRGVGWRPEAVIRFGPAYLVAVGVALPVLTGLFTARAVRALHRQSGRRQALVDQLSVTRAELAAASRLAGRAEERQRLAHELHDTLAQGLSGVVLQLDAAEQHLDGGAATEAGAGLARARETARACLVDTRRAVEALRPESLDGGTFADAVAQLCRRWTEMTGVPVRLTVRASAGWFSPRVEVVALRVVQEALANTGKHAAADEVTVTVEYRATELYVVVRDDGRGFDTADPPHPNGHTSGGFGLATMRERVAVVGGMLSVTSAPSAGTTVTAILPDEPTTTKDRP